MSQLLPPSLPRQGKKEQRGKGAREGGKENGSLSLRPSPSPSPSVAATTPWTAATRGAASSRRLLPLPLPQPNGGGGGRGPREALPPPPPLGAHIRQVCMVGGATAEGGGGVGKVPPLPCRCRVQGGRKRGIIYSCFRNADRGRKEVERAAAFPSLHNPGRRRSAGLFGWLVPSRGREGGKY